MHVDVGWPGMQVQAAVADARKGPVLLSSNSCAWPLHRKYMLRLAAGEARRVYMEGKQRLVCCRPVVHPVCFLLKARI